jgi:type II secretory pathway pseudopilin PulG
LIGIIIVAVLPNLKEQKSKEDAIERENRRLREQLVQEQIKTEAFRRHASSRLDAHDSHIGVDTRSLTSALPVPNAPQGLPSIDPSDELKLASDPWPGNTAQPAFGQFNQPSANNSNGNLTPPPNFQPGTPAGFQPPVPANYQQPPIAATMAYGAAMQPAAAPAEPAVTAGRQWYFERQGATQGPVTDKQLVDLAKQGKITTATLIWTEQLHDWKPAGSVKPLQPYLQS